MSKESKFISCVIYIHNDEANIAPFLDSVTTVMRENFDKYEFICVNDSSSDRSRECIETYFETHTDIKLINIITMSYYQGIEASMNAGRDLAIGDVVIEFDGIDFDYKPSLLMEVYAKFLEGYDIVAASPRRNVRLSSRVFYALYNWGSFSANKLEHETFRFISRRAINRINQLNSFVPYRKAMYMNCGLKAYNYHYEEKKKKKKGFMKVEKERRNVLAFDSFIFFTNVIERIAILLSAIFLGITLLVAVYILYSIFSSDRPVEGWLSIMGFMAFGFFGFFIMITLVLKYLSTILDTIFRQKRYVIEDIDKIAR